MKRFIVVVTLSVALFTSFCEPVLGMTAAQALKSGIRERLTAPRTYYVRSDGADTNSGLVDSTSGAFLTVQKAIDTISTNLDLAGYGCTVQVGDGTYTSAITLKSVVGWKNNGDTPLIIQGNTGTPTNVVISTTSASAVSTAAFCNAIWNVRNMRLQTTTSGNCISMGTSSCLFFSGIDFGACAGNHINGNITARVEASGNYTISGNATNHISSTGYGGRVSVDNVTVTVTANVTFTNFVVFDVGGYITSINVTFTLGAYTVTGKRYLGTNNGITNTSGGGANYFPGNAAGSVASGAIYL